MNREGWNEDLGRNLNKSSGLKLGQTLIWVKHDVTYIGGIPNSATSNAIMPLNFPHMHTHRHVVRMPLIVSFSYLSWVSANISKHLLVAGSNMSVSE